MKIKLTKINIAENAKYPTATDKSKQASELNGESPWVDYTVVGETKKLPKNKECFSFLVSERN